MVKGYRIISIEAADIYKHEQEYSVEVGYKMPEAKSDAYFWLFKNILDYSLDTVELESAYTRICRKKFSFVDKHNNAYTLAVVNVKFNYTYKSADEKVVNKKALRDHFYSNGFNLDGVHYVRYKRSAGSSREGKCLFIDERLYRYMTKWSECGIKRSSDLASWESYRALSLSSIKGVIDIPLNGILFVPDYKSTFTDKVVSVEMQDGKLIATEKETQITNDIWDGESLLDESLFVNEYADKHFLLLRNKFFKSCAFRTKLQAWIKDKNITLDDLKTRGFTLATDISQIVMVTTPNSLKYLKFVGALNEKNIRKWTDNVNSTFGVVKWDKRTRYFGGRMVQTSYQLLNTVFITEKQAKAFLQPSIDYIATIRSDTDLMKYHFYKAFAREKDIFEDDERDDEDEYLLDRAEVIFAALDCNYEFEASKLYINFRNEVVRNLKRKLRQGKILLNGTNATLFGNGPELLKFIAGEEIKSELNKEQIRCTRFPHKTKLLCARSPHITMGNLYLAENNLDGDIWNYFDLGENIVCINAINENIQQRLNGCDYDSDAMLVTDNALLIKRASDFYREFKVPVCNIPSVVKADQPISDLDYNTSNNKVGEIVNLSQRLNSYLWDLVIRKYLDEQTDDIYYDICKLAVMSGIEIDKAKRAYDNINVNKELIAIRNKYDKISPDFFKEIDFAPEDNKEYTDYYTAMGHIYKIASNLRFNKGKLYKIYYSSPAEIVDMIITSGNSTDYRHRDKVLEVNEEYRKKLAGLYDLYSNTTDKSEKTVLYETIQQTKAEREALVNKLIDSYETLVLLIKYYEQHNISDWRVYEPLIKHPLYSKMYEGFNGDIAYEVVEDPNGDIPLYDLKFTKVNRYNN